MVCKLLKFLYGLKQSLHVWNRNIDACLLFEEFEKNYVDYYTYFKRANGNSFVMIILYFDDLIVAFNDLTLLGKNLLKKFEMVNLCEIQYLLGVQENDV
jgi:hypothetical protein